MKNEFVCVLNNILSKWREKFKKDKSLVLPYIFIGLPLLVMLSLSSELNPFMAHYYSPTIGLKYFSVLYLIPAFLASLIGVIYVLFVYLDNRKLLIVILFLAILTAIININFAFGASAGWGLLGVIIGLIPLSIYVTIQIILGFVISFFCIGIWVVFKYFYQNK